MSHDTQLDEVTRRLDVIAGLLAMLVAGSEVDTALARRIAVLHGAGLGPTEIGRIVGKASNYVSAVLGRTDSREKTRRSNDKRGKRGQTPGDRAEA